jgi:hypothetical protein
MEDTLKQKDDELNNVLDAERNRESTATAEKKEWSDLRLELESKLADAQSFTESLQSELDRVRDSHASTEKDLQAQLEELRASGSRGVSQGDLELENDELRSELREQRQVTDEVRREAQEFLREMRKLSEQTSTSFDREEQYTKTINKLEEEVRDWRNRYARTKTQLRSLRASSMGLTILPEAAKYTKDSGFTRENGLVKDVHVTNFQISIDELLQMARADDPARVIEFMKAVVVSVRRITQDIGEAPQTGESAAQLPKLKSRVSATANNLITASKNFALANGLSPVSLLDAAASHLTAAVVELVRTVKIRPTPAGELDDDDNGSLEPVDPTGFFPVRDPRQGSNPPPFLGLPNGHISADSSMYSPINSPRESTNVRPRSLAKETWAGRQRSLSRGATLGNGYTNGVDKTLPPPPMGDYAPAIQEGNVEKLKVKLSLRLSISSQNLQT